MWTWRLSTLRLGERSTDWASPRIPQAGESTQFAGPRRIPCLGPRNPRPRTRLRCASIAPWHRASTVRSLPADAPLMTQQQRNRADVQPEPVSPELALVDPELARRERARIEAGESTGATTPLHRDEAEPSLRERLIAAGADPQGLVPATLAADREDLPTRVRQGGRPRRSWGWQVPAGIAVVGLIAVSVAFLLGQDVGTTETQPTVAPRPAEDTNRPAASPTETAARPPASKRPRRPAPPTPTTRTFVWPPVAAATFYRVEFFTRGRKVFEASPTKPRLTLPARWRYRGRAFRLSRGTYRWRVRPAFGRSSPRLGAPITRSTWTVR